MNYGNISFFLEYAKSFSSGIPEIDRNLKLKQDHSLRVLSLTGRICAAEPEAAVVKMPAQYAALYHDLSRFEQFRQYRSFNDLESFDHGERSAELTAELHLLDELELPVQEDCLAAIRVHNKASVPSGMSTRARLMAEIVRDADKLDIMRILTGHLKNPGANPSIVFKLSSEIRLTPAIRAALLERKPARHSDMRSAVDFLAGKLQWIEDLNFDYSRKLFLDSNFHLELKKYLPDTAEIRELFALFFG